MQRSYVKTYKLLTKILSVLAIVWGAMPVTAAQNNTHTKQQTLLIVDSYYENDPWSNSIIIPVAKQLSHIDSVHCEIVHLNNCLLSDSIAYAETENRVFDKYSDNPPQYLLMIGNTAFNLRDRIKSEWGDIPFLLVSRSPNYGPLDYYFSSQDNTPLLDHPLDKIRNLRDEYNFTMIVAPDHYKGTVDMMMHMIPDMEELVFFADPMYHNRNLSYNINNYLAANYPTVKYRWVVGDERNAGVFREYLIHKHPRSGLLLSTWFYKPDNASLLNAPTVGELNLISSSVNPFFALRQSYIELGALGGVYCNFGLAEKYLTEVIEKMLAGESMQEIPFYEDDNAITLVNYPILKSMGIPEDLCPKDTTFIAKPPTLWERNRWNILIILALLSIFSYIFIRRSISQRRQSVAMKRQLNFVNNMPVPFTKALIEYNKAKQIRDVKYTIMNDAFKELIRDNAIPDNPYLLFPAAFISEKVEQLVSTHEMVMFTYHFDNTDSFYEFIICEVSMPDKKIVKSGGEEIDIFAINITQRYKMEADLKKTTEKLNITLNVAKMTAWQWDVKSNTITFDSQFHTAHVLDDIATLGKDNDMSIDVTDYMTLIHPDDIEAMESLRNDLLSGTVKDFSLQFRILRERNTDEYEWIEINGVVTDYFIDASPKTITGSFLNITERKEEEQKMADAITRANESDQLKSAFLANMSHEIRTPLNAIIGFSNLLTETDDPNKKREFSDIINRNNDLLLSLVNDVLDLAKIESNTIDINYSVVDLNELITNVEKASKLRLQKGVMLNTVLGADQCVVVLDNNRVQQVLINLLSNACKFTHRGSISFGYEINTDEQQLYFYVKDTGIGMTAEQIESVFQRFYKADNFTQGTGLGLAICKSLVEKMQGEIGANSRGSGKGSTFWFTLPYRPATEDMSLEQEFISDNFDFAGISTPQPLADNKVATILVAEDNDSNYRLIEHLLTNRFHLVHAHNGIEAIDMFRTESPDLIIMDINMPELDGYDAVKAIRQESQTVPIIGVTAYAYASDRKRILSSGFNDYVAKPINPKLLYDAIDRFISPR